MTDLTTMDRRLDELSYEIARLRDRVAAAERRSTLSRAVAAACGVAAFATLPFATQAQSSGSTVKAPFQVVDAAGKVVMKAEMRDGRPQVSIAESVVAGTGASGAGFMIVRTATGQDGASIGQHRGNKMGVRVIGADGVTSEASLTLDARNAGLLEIGRDQGGGAFIGVGASGTGYANIRNGDGKVGASIGKWYGAGMGLSLIGVDGQTVQGSLVLDSANRGRLSVGVPNAARGVLGLNADGNPTFTLFNAANQPGAALLTTGAKSEVFVQSKGQTARVIADDGDGSLVSLFRGSGGPAARLSAGPGGNGELTLGDAAGQTMVQAGVATGGFGIVRAGPRLGGVSGVSNAGLVLPNSIVGQK